MKLEVYELNSFAVESGGGNPAAVVLDADALSEEQMLMVAKKVGFSETAFVMKSERGDIKVRYFTPVREVSLCGHATIAVFSLLSEMKILVPGKYRLETIREVLEIELSAERVMMNMEHPKFYEYVDLKEVAETLNAIPEDFLSIPSPEVVSTGLKDLIIPVKNKEILFSIRPDLDEVQKLSDRYGAEGYHLFALSEDNKTVYTRNFAPSLGIPEEAATGTASGALAAYLFKHASQFQIVLNPVIFKQGEVMGRPSEIHVKLESRGREIQRIQVGGSTKDTVKVIHEI